MTTAPPANVVVEDFVDFDALFPHVDAFVSNGGYGSILTALRHGVPVIGAGKRESKNDNNRRIGVNRLGVDLRTDRPASPPPSSTSWPMPTSPPA